MREIDVQRALQNYHKLVDEEKKLLEKIEYLQTKLVGKVSSSVITRPETNESNEQRKLGWIERKSEIEKDLDRVQYELNLVKQFLQFLPKEYEEPIVSKQLIRDMYIEPKNKDYIEEHYYFTLRTVYNHINKSIEEFINAN